MTFKSSSLNIFSGQMTHLWEVAHVVLFVYFHVKKSVTMDGTSSISRWKSCASVCPGSGRQVMVTLAWFVTVALFNHMQALFRALKTKGNTPKYGIIYHSTFIGRAAAKNKGRISRVLANKCSIASRIDR